MMTDDSWEQRMLDHIESDLTEIDLQLWQWQTDLDMMSFIGQDIPMRTYVPEKPVESLTVQRVPLTKGWGEREIIGIAEVDMNSGVAKVEVDEQYKELFGVPSAFSIADEDPPKWDHDEIKEQLRSLIRPALYQNEYVRDPEQPLRMKIGGNWIPVTGEIHPLDEFQFDPEVHLNRETPGLKMMLDGEWKNVSDIPEPLLDNHPFFKKEQ